jgi:hypothetical protein
MITIYLALNKEKQHINETVSVSIGKMQILSGHEHWLKKEAKERIR